jgi:general secretion pathway protein H
VNGERQKYPMTPGFTLLELMVVLVIAGLMLALVPPLFSGAVSGVNARGAARDLAIALRETRSLAVIRNTEQQVHLDLVAPRYRAGGGKLQTLPEGIAMSVELATGLGHHGMTRHTVRFFPDGSSSGELINLTGAKRTYHLQLDWLTGSITITEGTGNGG